MTASFDVERFVQALGLDQGRYTEEERERLRAALEELEKHHKRLLLRLYYEQLTVSEVARRMNIDRRTVYRRRDKAIGELRRRFDAVEQGRP